MNRKKYEELQEKVMQFENSSPKEKEVAAIELGTTMSEYGFTPRQLNMSREGTKLVAPFIAGYKTPKYAQ